MLTIVMVEDNPDNAMLVEALLEDRYDLISFDNGPEALEELRRTRPDLMLLDISLPGMDGKEVLARIRADPALADLPVIALTAHAMAGDREQFLLSGFDGYVSKPILDESFLIGEISRLMRSRAVTGAAVPDRA